jgi:hypothetical protein
MANAWRMAADGLAAVESLARRVLTGGAGTAQAQDEDLHVLDAVALGAIDIGGLDRVVVDAGQADIAGRGLLDLGDSGGSRHGEDSEESGAARGSRCRRWIKECDETEARSRSSEEIRVDW